MRSRNDKSDIAALARVFVKYPGIHAVYLFGSRVSGKIHDESDMDFAIVPQDDWIQKHIGS